MNNLWGLSLLLLIVLKLFNIITWSWWLVFTPLWLYFVVVGLVVLVIFLMLVFNKISIEELNDINQKNKKRKFLVKSKDK